MPTEQEHFMAQALALAEEAAAAGEVPVGCVIVRDGEIVGRGRNRREEKQATASHAEMEAIAQANAAPGHLAAGGLRAVCDPGALPHVRRGHPERPHPPGVVRRPGRGLRCLRRGAPTCLWRGFPTGPPWWAGILGEDCRRVLADFFAGSCGAEIKNFGPQI